MSTKPPKRIRLEFTEEQEKEFNKFRREFVDRLDRKATVERLETLQKKLLEGIGPEKQNPETAVHILLPNGNMKPAFSIAMDYHNKMEKPPLSLDQLFSYQDALEGAMKIDKLASLLHDDLPENNKLIPIINEYNNIKNLSVEELLMVLPKMERQINAIIINVNESTPDHVPPQLEEHFSENKMHHIAAQWDVIQKNHNNPKWEILEKKRQAEESESFANPLFKEK